MSVLLKYLILYPGFLFMLGVSTACALDYRYLALRLAEANVKSRRRLGRARRWDEGRVQAEVGDAYFQIRLAARVGMLFMLAMLALLTVSLFV